MKNLSRVHLCMALKTGFSPLFHVYYSERILKN